MAADSLLVSGGEVIEVQLTSETVVIENRGQREVQPGHITNRMRLFVREPGGAEKKYDFEDTELGVRTTQRIGIVRLSRKDTPAPVNLILYNLSSGEKDTFERAIERYLRRKPLFGPPWKAAAFSLAVALLVWLISHYAYGRGAISATFIGLMFAFLTYPAFWWLSGLWDSITENMRYRAARTRFIAEMDARVQAFAAPATEAA